jgi:rhamnosyltransferase
MRSISLHDWLVYAFYRASRYKWIIDDDYKMRYRQHHSNQVGVNKSIQAKMRRIKLFTSGWYKTQVGYISQFIELSTPDFTSRWQVVKNIKEVRRKRSERAVLFFMVIFGLY